ncbi:MAG: TRAP transporter small permease subunit [Reichenbachiella sp.]
MMEIIINKIEHFIESVGKLVSWLSLFLVILIGIDVALRYLFNWNSSANQELEWHLFATLFLLGTAYTLKHDKHVRVDLFYANFSEKNKARVNLVGTLIFLMPFCLVLVITSIPFVIDAWSISESSPEPGGLPYRYIIKSTIPIAGTLLFIQSIAVALKNLSIILKPTQS